MCFWCAERVGFLMMVVASLARIGLISCDMFGGLVCFFFLRIHASPDFANCTRLFSISHRARALRPFLPAMDV